MSNSNVKLEAVKGDITKQENISAIVNAANAELQIGSGVAGAIHTAAGKGLAEECRALAPIKTGEAVITGAYELPNQHIIHVLGPIYGFNKPEVKLLSNCYENALTLAENHNIESIAFPAISTGAFGYPFEDATEIVLSTVQDFIKKAHSIKKIRFVLFSNKDYEYYENKLRGIK
ncbi:macro domain-containing protein [Marivirga tractuosa]|uniref:macro domain-containing protein n=1 Tax=Marivirga tractuosa TaxID=1006 RepID=UPI0035CEF847